ncbi:hypothetical protein FKP32DRAFT_879069 [Trametes sanguinea]|nr:hypothetical protein FKP32DRAFT_879069 [Trametes sanguinea]
MRLGYEQHKVTMKLHEDCKKERAERKKNGGKLYLDDTNFQDPTLGSQRPLADHDLIVM